ncbi:MAG: GntR family transcriptional regulator [Chloroflexota bacterium]|nr:GntR family transcriptional regulator [Chloroflexota bacterium]
MPNPLDRSADAPPLYVQIAEQIKAHILNGDWREGERIPPEKVLCDDYAIARGTLRQALQILEGDGYLRREQGRGTFIMRPKSERANAARTLAFIVPYVRDSSVPTMLMGFQSAAEQAGYLVSFSHVNNDPSQQDRIIAALMSKPSIAGIALYPVDSDHVGALAGLARDNFPLVLVDRYLKTLATDYVMTDHFGGGLRATHYLLDAGHRRVGFATWLSPAVSMEHRYLGYVQALRERDIELDEALICTVEGYPTVDLTSLREFLDQPERPTAIFAANDQIAMALYRAAAAQGLRIPDDLSVVGFDNLDVAQQLDPPLTTIAQPFAAIGAKAAEILLRRIDGESGEREQIALPTQMIARGSCCPRILLPLRSTPPIDM